jgi:hypothetical protein
MALTPRQIQNMFGELEAERAACNNPRDRIEVDLKIVELQERCPHPPPYMHYFPSKDGTCTGYYCECCGKSGSEAVK